MNDFFAVPDFARLVAAGELAPDLPEGGFQGLSGLRYPTPRVRGLAPWQPRRKTREILDQVDSVLTEYAEYLPLTVRQVFYRLVGKFEYPKNEKSYENLGEKINRARRSGWVSWDDIRDDSLTNNGVPGFAGPAHFWRYVQTEADDYILTRSHGQPRHTEVWCEASGMVPQLERVAHEFGVGVRSASGFEGMDLKHDVATAAIGRTQPTVILRIGDFDQSGVSIFDAFADDVTAMCADYGKPGIIEFRWILVRPEHVGPYGLEPGEVKARKDNRDIGAGTCPNTGLPYNQPWTHTIQAEAFAPDDMAELLRTALREALDMDTLAEAIAASEPQKAGILERLGLISG